MDPGILVPPKGYGGHERLVYLFARQYCEMGHDVHILSTEGSHVEGCTMYPFGKEGFPQKEKDVRKAILYAWNFLWKNRNNFDLIHNFGRLLYLLPILNHPVKKIMTYGREISFSNINKSVSLPNKNLVFTGCSHNLIRRNNLKGKWYTVYNAIDFSKYQLQKEFDKSAPLIFLGRLEKIKGCHTAIKIAIETGNALIIAGNISPLPEEQEYFKREIEPYIDGNQITHVGQVNDEQKDYFLQKAKGLLFPIEWNEPFGIVMIEAMACGTPVIAFNRGSVDEVVEEGVTGFKVNTFQEMAHAVSRLSELDRTTCRHYALSKFNAPGIARKYLSLFDNAGKKKIVIVTTGQPAANPRVMKEYEALLYAGYQVKVLYTYSAEWSHHIDKKKFDEGLLDKNDFILAGGSPHNQKLTYFFSRVLYRFFKIAMQLIPISFFKEMAVVRSSLALWVAASKYKADFYIAHYVGALPAAAHAAKKNQVPFAFDAEDYHRGEPVYYANQKKHITYIEDQYLPTASFISGASPLIARAYKNNYPGVPVITVNNVFSRKFVQQPVFRYSGTINLFWFSQNIGPNRGLEIIIEAMNIVDGDLFLYLLGNNKSRDYIQLLLSKSKKPENIKIIEPVVPENVFSIAASFDIGLASEMPLSENRNLCLTNKIFTYLLSGNCIIASDTEAQKMLLDTYQNIGMLYKADDPAELAVQIKKLINNRSLLNEYRQNALDTGYKVLNWETERNILIEAVTTNIQNRPF